MRIARLDPEEGHGRRAVVRETRADQARTRLGRLQKTRLHLDGHTAAGAGIERSSRHRHRHIEQRHEHSAVGHRPTVEVPRLKVERHYRAALGGADELDAEFLDKGDVEPKGGRLSHTKPYLAPPVHVNRSMSHALRVAGTMSATMTASAASILRFAAMLLATLLLGMPAA